MDSDKEHSVTNVEEVECSFSTLPGEDGTEKSILPKEDTLLLHQSPISYSFFGLRQRSHIQPTLEVPFVVNSFNFTQTSEVIEVFYRVRLREEL